MSTISRRFFVESTKQTEIIDFFHGNGLNKGNFPQEFFMILGLFEEDSNCNLLEAYIDNGKLIIIGLNYDRSKKCELMLRFGDRQLIVARVSFIHQRQGYMTRLYGILRMIRKKYNLDRIVLEQCITEGSLGWAEKHGFVNCYGQSYQEP